MFRITIKQYEILRIHFESNLRKIFEPDNLNSLDFHIYLFKD
jgi:hypothetical protein